MPHVDAVIVGLGNPGSKYLMTRHNVGFLFLDVLAQDFGSLWDSSSTEAKKSKSEICSLKILNKSVLSMKPQTFMNLSGQALEGLYSKTPQLKEVPLIVIHDEVDLAFGHLRAKFGGGDAGHNGLKDIRRALGHGDYFRIRVGVGRPSGPESVADYVLQNFTKVEKESLMGIFDHISETLKALLNGNLSEAQTKASRCGLV